MKFLPDTDNFLRSKQVTGIECTILPGGDSIIRTVILKENKSRVEVVSSTEFIKPADLKNSIPGNLPVILILTGKGIIHKRLALHENESDKNLLQSVLPNAEVKDFYLEKHFSTSTGNNLYVSVARKSFADEVLNSFKNNGYHVIGCTLGPFCFQAVLPLISDSENFEIAIYNHHFIIQGKKIENYKSEDIPVSDAAVNIGGNSLQQPFAMAFAAAFQYLLSGEKSFSLQPGLITSEQHEFKQKRIFEKTGWAALIIFLGVLLINFFLFQHYSAKNAELNSQSMLLQSELENYKALEKDYKDKQDFFSRNGLLETSKTSYYADRIAQELLPAIRLTGINIFPAVKSTGGEEDKLSFKPKVITVSGQCNVSSELNEWMKVLKKNKWIDKVSLLDYRQDNLKTPGQFTIELGII
ncbi:MAG: hypothetical protein ACHQNT_06240 [Bacteroidia bacterium]